VTQVVDVSERQIFHNRLTHSLKVAQLGRRLAEQLVRRYSTQPEIIEEAGGIDPDVVEAACRAHDLGHPPFGHIGESQLQLSINEWNGDRLNVWMREDPETRPPAPVLLDGFEGNAQTFRIVTKLSVRTHREGRAQALNLTRATLAAILKYPVTAASATERYKWGAYESEAEAFGFATALLRDQGRPSIEAQIMDWADDISYAVHDLEDFIRVGRIPIADLRTGSATVTEFVDRASARLNRRRQLPPGAVSAAFERVRSLFLFPGPYTGDAQSRGGLHDLASGLIATYVNDVAILNRRLHVEPAHRLAVDILKELTWCYVIDHPGLATKQRGQQELVAFLFKRLVRWVGEAIAEPAELPRLPVPLQTYLNTALQDEGLLEWANDDVELVATRAVVDYISSLTEGQAVELYHRLTGLSVGQTLEGWL
jgi:dGTPase